MSEIAMQQANDGYYSTRKARHCACLQ